MQRVLYRVIFMGFILLTLGVAALSALRPVCAFCPARRCAFEASEGGWSICYQLANGCNLEGFCSLNLQITK